MYLKTVKCPYKFEILIFYDAHEPCVWDRCSRPDQGYITVCLSITASALPMKGVSLIELWLYVEEMIEIK